MRDLLDAVSQARNEIVHGGGELSKLSERLRKSLRACTLPVEVHELPDRCDGLTLDFIRTYVESLEPGESIQAVNAELDDRIADALAPRTG
jgi:hypothetical protein